MKACDCLPICAVVNDSIFAVHAGISPLLKHVETIDTIDRFHEIPLISFLVLKIGTFIRTRGCFVIYYGPIHPMKRDGFHRIVELVIPMDLTHLNNF